MIETKKIKLPITTAFNKWATVKKRIKIAYGGRGGGKSLFIATLLIGFSFEKKGTFLCTRETQASIETSVYPMLVDIIVQNNLQAFFKITKSEIINKLTRVNFIFTGLREWSISNIKSAYDISICWIEEAESITLTSWTTLEPSIRGYESEIWVSFNPRKPTDTFYKMLEPYMNKLEGYSFIYKKKKYRYKEYEDKDFIITNVNYDSNQFFSAVLEKSRLMTLKIQPNLYSHIWLGDLHKEQGKIFLKEKLKFYNIEEMAETFTHYITRAVVDPAFGEKSCFTSCILYTQIGNDIYINDSGLLRANQNQTTDELIESFLIHNKIKEVYCEANFSQSELIKKLKRRFTVKPFYSKQNKIERIVNASISIYERVYFPTLWITSPEETNTEKYIETSHGRGFIALQQLLNFSDIATENCRKGDDFSFVDFPDALASLINHAKRSYSDTETDRPTFEDKIKVLFGDED